MIAKITRGSSPAGLAAYLHGPGRANEHVYGGVVGGAVIGGTLGADGSRDGRGWAADMQLAIDARPEVVGPVWHMSLRNTADDRVLLDREWRHVAQTMGERMGWADRPWVMVRHGADHVHVVVSRVGWDRSLWHGRNDRRAAQEARRYVEQEMGLKQAPVRPRAGRSLTSGEVSRALRTGVEPPREDLARRVQACADAARGLGRETFEGLLTAQGVAFRANVASTGRVSGYSFALPDHRDAQGVQVWWKGSQLDRALGWKTLGEGLTAPLPEPRVEVPAKRTFERRSSYEQRVEQVRVEARAADVVSRREGAYRVAASIRTERSKSATVAWRLRQVGSERTTIAKKRDALGRRVQVTERPISHIDAEALEARRIAALGFPRSATRATGTPRVSPTRGTSTLPYADRSREQGRGRGIGR